MQHLSKDVYAELIKIVQDEAKMDPEESRQYVRNLQKERRFLMDVY